MAKLIGSAGEQLDNFDSALAVRGDSIFVAAADQDNGMVYHYRRNQGGSDAWGEVQQLVDPAGRKNDSFGSSLAFNGTTLVVGSHRSDVSGLFENDGAGNVCTNVNNQAVEQYLSDVHEKMTSPGGYKYDEPWLRNLSENLNMDSDPPSLASLGYTAYIESNLTNECITAGGKEFLGIQCNRRYFAVLTNVTESTQNFRLRAELTGGP